MNWNDLTKATTYAKPTPHKPIDWQAMLTKLREWDASKSFHDAMRDVRFEDLRRRGIYIKAERDSRGELWVVDDRLLEKFKSEPSVTPAEHLGLVGVRVVPLSQWRREHRNAPLPPGQAG